MYTSHQIYNNLNDAFLGSILKVASEGEVVNSRGSTQKEILFHHLILNNPRGLTITEPSRRFNINYAITEWLWYLSGKSNVNNIGKMAQIWNRISDLDNVVESNYGSYFFQEHHYSQWRWIIEELISDRDTRRASLSINQPYHKNKNHKDYPCTQYLQFFIRGNKLHMAAYMRSNDAVYGFCNDVYTFCLFQQLMLNELNLRMINVELGSYYHFAGSFHVYERHFKMLNHLTKKYDKNGIYLNASKTNPKNTTLKPHIDLEYIKKNNLYLSEDDMTKEQIIQFSNEVAEVIFE